MYIGTYAPWENAPKLLRHYEIMEPMKVVIDFFEIDTVSGHDERFKEWRDYAIRSEHYVNERNGPGALLYLWEENVRLIEAMYLIWHGHRNNWSYKPATEEQLVEEKINWDYFPKNLDNRQLADPYSVIEKFFREIPLAVYRDYLYEWLNMALSKILNRDPVIDAEEVITVYENVLELHAAAWIICQRNSPRPHLKRDSPEIIEAEETNDEQQDVFAGQSIATEIAKTTRNLLKPPYPKPTPAESLGLQKIKEILLERYTTVQMIVFLGSTAEPFTSFLLLLVSNEEKTEEGHLSCNIENYLQYLAHTHIILHKASSAIAAMKKGNRFWNMALSKGYIIHQSPDIEFWETKPVTNQIIIGRAIFHWNCWGKQGEELIKGAQFYFEGGNYRLAAFTLHKATETILKAIIQSVIGYRIQMHNVSRLLRLTLLFTDELNHVFQLNTKAGVQSFDFLKNAYAQSHYSETFNPNEATIETLLEKVRALYQTSEVVYQQYTKQYTEEINQ